MKPETYLSKYKISQADFARTLSKISGKSVEACAVIVSRMVNHGHIPVPEMVGYINVASNGEIPPNDLYTLKKPRKVRQ